MEENYVTIILELETIHCEGSSLLTRPLLQMSALYLKRSLPLTFVLCLMKCFMPSYRSVCEHVCWVIILSGHKFSMAKPLKFVA